MELYFVRHGETEFNRQGRAMGQRINVELDKKGLEQAHEVMAKLPPNFAAIYCSPLKRAVDTARIIADHFNKNMTIKQDLRERDFGTLSGKTWDEMDSETGLPIHQMDNELRYDYTPYGGESVAQVKARLDRFLAEMQLLHKDEKVVVVAHFGMISLMNSMYPQTEKHELANTSVHKFVI